jgi:signal transduction histidine kinase
VAQSHGEDILADFAHQLRQPLTTLDALAFYLGLIAKPEDTQVHEQLSRMHAEIAHTDQVLRDGLCTLRAHFLNQGCSVLADVPPAAAEGCLPSISDRGISTAAS